MSILSGSLDLNGNITSSGDISFSISGSGVVQTITEFTPTGTASYGTTLDIVSTNTTTYLSYGINIVATGSVGTGSYCCYLPQTPKKGKSVTIINDSGADLLVFPSTASGDINGAIDGYFVVPPDGQSYVFNCYENPLPGGWSSVSTPSGNITYNTGVITFNDTNNYLSFVNQSLTLPTDGVIAGSIFSSVPSPSEFGIFTGPFGQSCYYIPTNTWKKVNSVTVLTNVTGSLRDNSYLSLVNQFGQQVFLAGTSINASSTGNSIVPYFEFTTMLNNWSLANLGLQVQPEGNSNWAGVNCVSQTFNSVTPGIFSPTIGNPNISSQGVGAPGTMRLIWVINPYMEGVSITRMVGKNYVGSAWGSTALGNNFYSDQLYDMWWYHSFSPYLSIPGNLNNIKFRMILNVTPN
jgi:hypothetical protein